MGTQECPSLKQFDSLMNFMDFPCRQKEFRKNEIHAHHGKIPFAVVSGSPRASVKKTLGVLGLLDLFPVIVGAEDTPKGKPHPDPFLLAAKKLGVDPKKCLVFEDGELGIKSAEAAGMKWVRVEQKR
jgi:beta-phosphoglucomutase-like phosphatase (HAD superfamily)